MYPEFLLRLFKEEKELAEKILKLIGFKDSDKYSQLDEIQKELLKEQVHFMIQYDKILRKRIEHEKTLLKGDTDGDK